MLDVFTKRILTLVLLALASAPIAAHAQSSDPSTDYISIAPDQSGSDQLSFYNSCGTAVELRFFSGNNVL